MKKSQEVSIASPEYRKFIEKKVTRLSIAPEHCFLKGSIW